MKAKQKHQSSPVHAVAVFDSVGCMPVGIKKGFHSGAVDQWNKLELIKPLATNQQHHVGGKTGRPGNYK